MVTIRITIDEGRIRIVQRRCRDNGRNTEDYRIAESLMARYLLSFYSDDEKAADATPKE